MVRSPHIRRTEHHRHPQYAAWMRRQARLPAIMWVSKPGPLRTAVPACASPIPAVAQRLPSGWLRLLRWRPTSAVACSTASPRSPTPATGVADGTRWARCWPSRCWLAPDPWPRWVSGPPTRPGRSWPRSGCATTRSAGSGAHQPRPPCAACWPASTPAPSTVPSVAGWPASPHLHQPPGRHHQPAGPAGGRGRRQDPARQRPPPQVTSPFARRDGPHHRCGPRPSRRAGHHQ
jgi:hypothetical protein